MPDSPLPGMPVRIGDPGVFVCGPGDIAPWESERPKAFPRAPSRPAPGRRWLVLALCPACGPSYCRDHGPDNWWLTHWGR